MNLNQKLPIAKRAIESISRHEDEDVVVRGAFLEELVQFIIAEKAAIDAQLSARIELLKQS